MTKNLNLNTVTVSQKNYKGIVFSSEQVIAKGGEMDLSTMPEGCTADQTMWALIGLVYVAIQTGFYKFQWR